MRMQEMTDKEIRTQKAGAGKGSWLNEYARNVTSQHGEDGIIEKVLEVMGENNKWCVEFGSWDGMKCSNTYNLVDKKGYRAVLIEGDGKRYKDLLKTFVANEKVTTMNAFVGFESDKRLDTILSGTGIPEDFDLLSIDIDGNDYHVWKDLSVYRPRIVVIEFNPTIGNEVEFVQPRDMSVSQGSSLLSMTKLAKTKGYELIAATRGNAVFVDEKYFSQFGIKDNSIEKIRADTSMVTHIFSGYDGRIFIRGCGVMPWQGIEIKESRVQQLPGWARKKAFDRNVLRRKLGRFFRRLRKKGII